MKTLLKSIHFRNVAYVIVVVGIVLLAGCTSQIIKNESDIELQVLEPQKNTHIYLEKKLDLLLLDAIANNDLQTAKKVIKDGADVNYKTERYWIFVDSKRRKVVGDFNGHHHPLPEKYTFMSDEEIAKIQLKYIQSEEKSNDLPDEIRKLFQGEQEADLEGRSTLHFSENGTPLELASKFGYPEIVKFLLSSGALYSEEAFFIAVQGHHLKVLQELLSEKRELNILSYSKSPLSIASANNDVEIAELLIDNGADIDFSLGDNAPNIDAFDVAIRHYNTAIIELFLKYKTLEELWKREQNLVFWIIDYNPLDDSYVTEYFGKSEDNRVEVLEVLLYHGLSPDQKNSIGDSPLVHAIVDFNVDEQIDIIEFLIQNGADVNEMTHPHGPGWGSTGKVKVLDLVNQLISKYPKNEDAYIQIKDILEKNGATSFYPSEAEMETAKQQYNKDLGNGYTQKLSGLEFETKNPRIAIYYYNTWLTNPSTPESFGILNPYYATDGKDVWFKGKAVPDIDSHTFQTLKEGGGFYAKDKNHIFAYGKKLEDSKSEDYQFLGDFFLQSNGNMYYEFKKIAGADIASWQVIKWPYSKDKNNVYREEKVLEGEDPKTFTIK
jgi:ankyrin repeat protein